MNFPTDLRRRSYRLNLLLVVAFVVGWAGVRTSSADTIADWTFENDIGKINSVDTGSNSALLAPASGIAASTATAEGYHANSSTQWTAIAGNGSSTAFNSIYWSVGDYYEFDLGPYGLSGASISFDQASSYTGPEYFKVQETFNGTTWTDLASGSYTVASDSTWSSSTHSNAFTQTFNLDYGVIGVRLVDTSTTPTSGYGSVSATGKSRIDNVIVTGIQITPSAVPEPSSLLMVGLGLGVLGLLKRRSS